MFLLTFFHFWLSQKSGICYTVTEVSNACGIDNSRNRMREDMSEGRYRMSAARRKRARTTRRLIILILVISVITCICCMALFWRVHTLNQAMQNTTEQLEEMKELLSEQQKLLEKIIRENNTPSLIIEEEADDSAEGEQFPPETAETVEAAHKVYLTFDDGPSKYTEEILDILDEYQVKATFFVVGKEGNTAEALLKKIVDNGHSLGMHSYSHEYGKIYESVESFAADFQKLQDYLYEVTGVKSTIYRFPGGSSNVVSDIDMQEFADYLEEQGVTFYDWNISSGDGGSVVPSVDELVTNCTKDIRNWNTSIILLHDSGEKRNTVDALPLIIENILALEDTVILPITEDTNPVQHIKK